MTGAILASHGKSNLGLGASWNSNWIPHVKSACLAAVQVRDFVAVKMPACTRTGAVDNRACLSCPRPQIPSSTCKIAVPA